MCSHADGVILAAISLLDLLCRQPTTQAGARQCSHADGLRKSLSGSNGQDKFSIQRETFPGYHCGLSTANVERFVVVCISKLDFLQSSRELHAETRFLKSARLCQQPSGASPCAIPLRQCKTLIKLCCCSGTRTDEGNFKTGGGATCSLIVFRRVS